MTFGTVTGSVGAFGGDSGFGGSGATGFMGWVMFGISTGRLCADPGGCGWERQADGGGGLQRALRRRAALAQAVEIEPAAARHMEHGAQWMGLELGGIAG